VRLLFLFFVFFLPGCTEDQSKAIGSAPKQTLDRAERDLDKALRQGAERSREEGQR
jgi:hypothetical protein